MPQICTISNLLSATTHTVASDPAFQLTVHSQRQWACPPYYVLNPSILSLFMGDFIQFAVVFLNIWVCVCEKGNV